MSKKQLIMDKALELFSEQGYEATSVQQITERCGISKGAFYLSFKTKDELVVSMIDYYLQQFIMDIDQAVKGPYQHESLLVEFYKNIFELFKKHSISVRVFFNEKVFLSKQELFYKISVYEVEMSQAMLYMLEQLYPNNLQETKYDVMYCMKGFIKTYAELVIFSNIPLDLEHLAKSLAEKTRIIAEHTTTPFITESLVQIMAAPYEQEIAQNTLVQLIEQSIASIEDSIARESLQLLKEQIETTTYNRAILKGLLANIRQHPESSWVAYVLAKYFHV
ncbi:TetR/AcrR family transcriptional regulator [Lysinibacillus piscis]|uniref:TetR family transcriptional regulator n=1 Tax=Lysinibacillus piscis TaxID=2518931 RepID=A0ABQ5NGY2_9BACI|nr:TetR/AcrR family transcriptional regulator [Lysinibacillus sp. KH24]GLC87625.1 TetR family transcriptional regulator [Lysinibacillus sp. KH24]